MDPEILKFFMEETSQLLQDLEGVLERIEEAGEERFPEAELREFAQKIDRVMGAAKTLDAETPGSPGVAFVANVCEACKGMGYQAAALKRGNLIPVFVGFWAETLEILTEVTAALNDPRAAAAAVASHSSRLQARLAWLAERVAPANEEERRKVSELLRKL